MLGKEHQILLVLYGVGFSPEPLDNHVMTIMDEPPQKKGLPTLFKNPPTLSSRRHESPDVGAFPECIYFPEPVEYVLFFLQLISHDNNSSLAVSTVVSTNLLH